MDRLQRIEKLARLRGYRNLEAKARAHRAYCLQWLGRPLEALEAFDHAAELERGEGDDEAILRIAARKMGILRNLGEAESAWREAAGLLQRVSRSSAPPVYQLLLGEAALTAHSLRAPHVALALQQEASRLARESLLRSPTSTRKSREAILGVALKERAALESDLGDFPSAMRDLAEAERLLGTDPDGLGRAAGQIRGLEAPSLWRSDPVGAIERFTDALRLDPEGEVGTLRATLAFERAGALERAGRSVAVEGDLRRGFAEIHRERARTEGDDARRGPDFLADYLARFRRSYELYLSLLLDRGLYREAFEVAERSRVFEPLSFLRGASLSPREVRLLAQTGAPLRLHEVQRDLPRGTVVVELAVLENRVVAWLVQDDRFEVVIQKIDRAVLVELTRRLERQVSKRLGREAAETLGVLDRAVFESIRNRLLRHHAERIVIVPDSPLREVPMAALLDVRTGRYLVENFVVSTAPSATLFVYCLLRDRKMGRAVRPSALLVGDPAFDPAAPEAAGLERLAGASHEVGILRRIYGREAIVLKEENATAGAFLADSTRARMVHYAGHAVILSPIRSYLALAPGKGRSGFLSAGEMLSELRLARTRLVVLAACSSAAGHPGGQVEIGALVRPIFAAGAPGILASVWSVGDDRSSRLLAEFHRSYAAGADAADALRQAQLCALRSRNPLARSVLSWASFEVIGYSSSDFRDPKAQGGNLSCGL